MLRLALILLLCWLLPSPALAEKRVALVIGNSAYQHTLRLANPMNDATDMVAVLKKHGFQVLDGFDLVTSPLLFRAHKWACSSLLATVYR